MVLFSALRCKIAYSEQKSGWEYKLWETSSHLSDNIYGNISVIS